MASFLRLALAMLGLCSLLVGGALVAGYQAQSKIVTYYHENEGVKYPLHIYDSGHQVQFLLSGSRCFDEVPTRFYTTSALNMGRWFTLDDASAADAVARLKC